jgi:hypothetical protein
MNEEAMTSFGPQRHKKFQALLVNNGRIILRWIFKKWEGVVGTGWSGLRYGNELSGSINGGNFLTRCKTS